MWRVRGTACEQRHITETTALVAVSVCACFSNACTLAMHVLDGTVNGVKYRDDILKNSVFPHSEDHNLASRPIFMDDNARPVRAQIVQQYSQDEAINVLPWLAFSPDLNPKEHFGIKSGKLLMNKTHCVRIFKSLVNQWQLF